MSKICFKIRKDFKGVDFTLVTITITQLRIGKLLHWVGRSFL